MKGLNVVTSVTVDSETKEIKCVVLSEPYPKIGNYYGSPPRSGATYSLTSSETCVVVQDEVTGEIFQDIPLCNIKIYTPPMTLYSFLEDRNIHLEDVFGFCHTLEAIKNASLLEIEKWNEEVDTLSRSLKACLSSSLPIPKNMIQYYFEGCPYFKEVRGGTYSAPEVELNWELEMPSMSYYIMEDYWKDKSYTPPFWESSGLGFYINVPRKLALDEDLCNSYKDVIVKFSIEDIEVWKDFTLSTEEIGIFDEVIRLVGIFEKGKVV